MQSLPLPPRPPWPQPPPLRRQHRPPRSHRLIQTVAKRPTFKPTGPRGAATFHRDSAGTPATPQPSTTTPQAPPRRRSLPPRLRRHPRGAGAFHHNSAGTPAAPEPTPSNRESHFLDAGGISACSRWSSEATPPDPRRGIPRTPAGVLAAPPQKPTRNVKIQHFNATSRCRRVK